MATTTGINIVTDNLVFSMDPANPKSYPGSGNLVYNLKNIPFTGSLLGDTTVVINPNTFVFDYDNDNDKISFQIPPTLNLTTSLTLEAWINQEQLAHVNHGDGIISIGDGSSNSANYEVIILNDKSVYFRLETGDGEKFYNPTSTTIDLNKWYHITCTFDTSTTMEVYINSIRIDTGGTTAQGETINTDNNIFYIGQRHVHSTGDLSTFGGFISACKIYNKALDENEVLQNYNALKSRFT